MGRLYVSRSRHPDSRAEARLRERLQQLLDAGLAFLWRVVAHRDVRRRTLRQSLRGVAAPVTGTLGIRGRLWVDGAPGSS
jgi:hypothetical protein